MSASDGGTDAEASVSASADPASADPRSFDEKRHDQLTSAPAAVESDADARIDVTTADDGTTRIDWRPDAPIKP